MNFPANFFDAAISNHTLANIPEPQIQTAISRISEQCRSVLIVELTRGKTDYSRSVHDYESLFKGKMHITERYEYSPRHDVMVFVKDGNH